MKRTLSGATVLLLLLSGWSVAAAPLSEAEVLSELSGEMMECEAYFIIVAECVENMTDQPGAAKLASDYRQHAENMDKIAIAAGKAAGMLDTL